MTCWFVATSKYVCFRTACSLASTEPSLTVVEGGFCGFGVRWQIVIGAVGNAFDFLELFRFILTLREKAICQVGCCFRIMRQLVRLVDVLSQILGPDPVFVIPANPLVDP